ncbi:hypothetical protein ES703_101671 [subsurface metagenome]
MVSLAVSIVDRAFTINDNSITFLRRLIIGLVVAGIVFGIVGCYVSRLIWLVEVLIAPTLFRAISSYQSINKNNVTLLNEANKTLEGAREQKEIEHRIKKEKTNG